MNEDFKEIVLFEIRENRKHIAKIDTKVNSLYITVGTVGAFFGLVGAYAVKAWAFFSR
jgi:hypothetical protein